MAIPSKVFGSIINTLLWFLPEKKRRRWRRGLIFSASIILLSVLAFMGVQRIGPIAEGPVEDPI